MHARMYLYTPDIFQYIPIIVDFMSYEIPRPASPRSHGETQQLRLAGLWLCQGVFHGLQAAGGGWMRAILSCSECGHGNTTMHIQRFIHGGAPPVINGFCYPIN